jgi:hypothetical protein
MYLKNSFEYLQKAMALQTTIHQIISITAARTQYGKRMWRCKTRDGVDVNIFASTLRLFGDYGEVLQMLEDNQVLRWTRCPIEVVLVKDGDYFNIVSVAPRPANAAPDEPFVPRPSLSAQVASCWAADILAADAVIWDTETTGTDRFYDEIVSIGIVRIDGTVLLHQVIRPQNLTRNAESGAQSVNGFSPDELAAAPAFTEVYPAIRAALQGKLWVIYNAAFDTVVLERTCLRHGLSP